MSDPSKAKAATSTIPDASADDLRSELGSLEADAESVILDAVKAFRERRWDEAQPLLEQGLKLKPQASLLMEMLGHIWFRWTDTEKLASWRHAEQWFLKALSIRRSARVLTVLGAVYVRLEKIESAVQSFEEAIQLDASYEEAMYNLGVLKADDEPERAMALFKRAVQLDPEYAIAHQELGKLYQKLKDLPKAEAQYRRCLEIEPGEYWSSLYLANALGVQKKNEEAEAYYEAAVRSRPEEEGGLVVFAQFLKSIGKHTLAAEVTARQPSTAKEPPIDQVGL